MKYRCKICKKEFDPKDHNVIDLAYHIIEHNKTHNKAIMPHDAIKEYELIDT